MSESSAERMPDADAELVARIQRGDPDAVGQLAERYGEPLRRIIAVQLRRFGMGRRQGTAPQDDPFRSEVHSVFNDAILRFVKQAKGGELALRDNQIVAYMAQIATNLLKSQLRRPGTRHALLSDLVDVPSWSDSPIDDLLADRESAARYQGLIAQLPEKCQRLIECRIGARMSFADIGATLSMPESAARARFSECLAKLREMGGESR